MRRPVVLALQVLLPLLALALLAYQLGLDAFRPALAVLAPAPLLAALLLGAVAVAAQAARWRVVMRGAGLSLRPGQAFAECYRSSALNVVLPGGVAGDVLRAWRQRTGAPRGWRPGAVSVVAERAVGFSLLLAAAAVALATTAPPAVVAGAAVLAFVALVVARPSLRRLRWRDRAAVWAWSALALAALLSLTAVTAAAIGVQESPAVVAALGLALLAGMSVPLNLGGWGPREATAAVVAMLLGMSPEVGVALGAGYGLLATASVLPGFLILGGLRRLHRVGHVATQIQLHAHVVAEDEAPHRSAEGVRQPVPTVEPHTRHAVAHQQWSGGQQ